MAAGAGGYAAYNYDTAYLVAVSVRRSSVMAAATCQVAWDYYRNFPALPPAAGAAAAAAAAAEEEEQRGGDMDPEERARILAARSAVHLRAAERIRRALMRNGGVYIKLGQHISALEHVLPAEWCRTMQALQDQNTPSALADVARVIEADTGQSVGQLFSAFDAEPLGVASLAQVHRAVLRETGEPVAVKVQHPMVRAYSDIDIATVSVLLELVHSVFPDFKFMWLGAEMRSSLPRELDFRSDKANAEQVAWNFAARPDIPLAVPRMIRATERVLVMEHVDGSRCDDLAYLRRHGIDPAQVSRAIGRVFAEMTFVHGFLHCDPHPGNLFVRPRSPGATAHGHNFELVLLDHGLYRRLPSRFRYEYAEMWRALMRGDVQQIQHWSRRLSGTDLYRVFSAILTGRDWSAIEAKSLAGGAPGLDVGALAAQQLDLLRQVADVLASVPPVLLLVLKTNDLLNMVNQRLFADQPPAAQRHAQTRAWLLLSRYCLMTVCDARAAEIRHSAAARSGIAPAVRRACSLLLNRLAFWLHAAALSAYSAALSAEDRVARWGRVLLSRSAIRAV
ncbi:hypothetical protein H4R18_002314 [Coemansia javaensis]|uniref:Protein kinase domain-containing protein n=1 Tax=Coemansia javaensis TaxID=2761396 RepID=A0A9W8HCI3_9FUNG|nr:hypothetical protein H4R18_002314 [Coemansia javaensis]